MAEGRSITGPLNVLTKEASRVQEPLAESTGKGNASHCSLSWRELRFVTSSLLEEESDKKER